MNDKELADKIISVGVGKAHQIYSDALGRFYAITDDWQESKNESKFVRDWRVAGALMEKIPATNLKHILFEVCDVHEYVDMMLTNPVPIKVRAIIEACVEALSKKG